VKKGSPARLPFSLRTKGKLFYKRHYKSFYSACLDIPANNAFSRIEVFVV